MSASVAMRIVALVLAAAGCSQAITGPASTREITPGLTGHWQGSVWEIGSTNVHGQIPLDLTLKDDGTWTGKVGRGEGSGVARIDRCGNLVLTGVAVTPDGHRAPILYTLRGDAARRGGVVVGDFNGRPEHASVLLRKTG